MSDEKTAVAVEEPAASDEPIDTGELANAHDARAKLYGFLSRLFRVEVDQLLLDQLRSMHFPAETGNDKMDSGYRKIAEYVYTSGSATLQELAVDYVRAFIGHGVDAHAAAYPFESVYTNVKRLMMAGARDEVLALYRSEGIEKSPDWHDPEDHIALELEFMRVLAERSAKALRDGDEAEASRLAKVQRAFVKDHLENWLPTFARDMRSFAKTNLYLGLADLVEGFVQTDRGFLDELAG